MSLNLVQIIGNLGRDPELRRTNSGHAVAQMNIATTRHFKTAEGEAREETEWHRVTVWGKQGEQCAAHLAKGRQVYVSGRLQTRKYQDKDGNDRYATDIVADRVTFLGSPGGGGRNEPPPPGDDSIPF